MEETPQNSANSDFWKELFKLVIISVLIVIPFRIFIARPFIVDGSSMYPTFKDGQYLIVDEVSSRFNGPARGSVLIFKYPLDPSKKFIKRVIGLPDETIKIENGKVTIINKDNPNGFVLDEPYVQLTKTDTATYILGDNEYFAMGDNRAASADSRIWGPVPKGNIIGRPVLRFYPPSLLPGQAVYPSDTANTKP